MGRNRTPDEIKRLRGNPRKEKLPLPTPPAAGAAHPAGASAAGENQEADAPAYEVPGWLADDAAEIFVDIADRFLPKNIIQETDFNSLARYAVAMADYIENYQALKKAGGKFILSKSKHNPEGVYRVLPYVRLMAEAEVVLIRLEIQLGLTPAARQTILARMRGLGGFDPWAGLPLGDAAREGVDDNANDSSAAGAAGAGGAGAPGDDGSPIGLLARVSASTQTH